MGIKVQPLTKEEYIEYCIPNKLDPIMFKLRVEKLGWTREQAATEPLGAYNKQKIWSHEEMGILIDKAHELRFGVIEHILPGRSIQEINKRKIILGLSSKSKQQEVESSSKKIAYPFLTFTDLDLTEKSILLGCLFGSGNISNKVHTDSDEMFFSCRDSHKHADYNLWKAKILSTFCSNTYKNGRGESTFKTGRHKIFTQLRSGVYGEENKERLPILLVKELGYLGLLIWYLEVGTLKPYEYKNSGGIRRGYMSILVEGINKSEVIGCIECLNSELGLSLQVRNSGYINFDTESMVKLIPIFEELFLIHEIPSCMLYKIGLLKREELGGIQENRSVSNIKASKVEDIEGGYLIHMLSGHQVRVDIRDIL